MKISFRADEGAFQSAACIRRYPEAVLTYKDVPYRSALVFNAGVIKKDGRYVMVFRNDAGDFDKEVLDGRTDLGLAHSEDGIRWKVAPQPCWEVHTEEISRVYDPRLQYIDGKYYLCFAMDTKHGTRGGIAVSDDLKQFSILSLSVPDNRNMVLFPEKIGGNYVRLERPMPVYSHGRDKFDIWISSSPDLVHWGNAEVLLATEDVPFCNDKIGPAAPPVKTEKGWLTLFHSVDIDPSRGKNGWEPSWKKRYCVGVMLLDLHDPTKIVGMSKKPLMVPETKAEKEGGFRNGVIFPCAMVPEEDGTVKIYYGAGDAVICMATANIGDLLALCTEPVKRHGAQGYGDGTK